MKPCRPMPASSTTNVRSARHCFGLNRAIAVYFVPTARFRAHRFNSVDQVAAGPVEAGRRGRSVRMFGGPITSPGGPKETGRSSIWLGILRTVDRSQETSGVRNIIFDLGGVVFDRNPALILESFYADPHIRATMKEASFVHPDWLQMDRGMLSQADMIARLEKRTGRPQSEMRRLFDAVRSSLRPKSETAALLERLAQRRVPLYCLSNMPASTFAYLRERRCECGPSTRSNLGVANIEHTTSRP